MLSLSKFLGYLPQLLTFTRYSSSTATLPSPVYSDKSAAAFPCAPAALPQPPAQQRLKTGMPLGFDKLLNHSPAPQSPPQPPPATKTTPKTHPTAKASPSRYHLHIRQQPLAARACGAGDRDRRPVDPPPIIQMLLTDFNPGSAEDKEILKDPRFTVGCFLFLAPPSPHHRWRRSSGRDARRRGAWRRAAVMSRRYADAACATACAARRRCAGSGRRAR